MKSFSFSLDWVNLAQYGCPDEEGIYLCKWSDGNIETFEFFAGDCERSAHWRGEGRLYVTWWAEIPPELDPEHDPSPDDQESVTRIGGWG